MASLTVKLLHDTGFSKNDGITNNAAVTGSGVGANAVVTVYTIFDGVYYSLGTTTANASGDWTFTPYGLAAGAYNYGVLLEQRGDVEGAKAAYQRALQSGDPEPAARAGEALERLTG